MLMVPSTFKSHAVRHRASSTSNKVPPGIAPALLTSMSTCGNCAASRVTLALSARSAASVRTETWYFSSICLRAVARSVALRETSTRLQPSAARASPTARPMPREPPVMSASLPPRFRSIGISYDFAHSQLRDLVVRIADLAKNLLRMLALFRYPRDDTRRRAGQADGLSHHANVAAFRVFQGRHNAEMADLGIGEHFIDLVDRAGRHALGLERAQPVGGRAFGEDRPQQRLDLRSVTGAARTLGIIGMVAKFRAADHLAEGAPLAIPADADIDESVGGRDDTHRRAGGMIVAGLRRHHALDQVAGGLKIHHRDLSLQQRGLDPLSQARALALGQRDQNARRRKHSGGGIGDGDACAHRRGAGLTGDAHEPAHALGDLVESGARLVRTALPEARNRREDDA